MATRRPYAEHRACHVAHVRYWPLHAKVWVAWGSMGWRPGVVVGYAQTRVIVRVTDGLWPFDGSTLSRRPDRTTNKAPNSLRARRGQMPPPRERATGPPSCRIITQQERT